MRVENVDVLDDRDPHVLVQRYFLPKRVYQVLRKPVSPDEQFTVSEGVIIGARRTGTDKRNIEPPTETLAFKDGSLPATSL